MWGVGETLFWYFIGDESSSSVKFSLSPFFFDMNRKPKILQKLISYVSVSRNIVPEHYNFRDENLWFPCFGNTESCLFLSISWVPEVRFYPTFKVSDVLPSQSPPFKRGRKTGSLLVYLASRFHSKIERRI